MLHAAMKWATFGAPVFPVWWITGGRCACGDPTCEKSAGKHPIGALVPNGVKDATTDEATIRRWWARYPIANIGTATSWATVLDVDPRHGGDVSLDALERSHAPIPDTPENLTGGGGRHIFFKPAPGLGPSAGKIAPGLDIKSGPGAYVLLPPSGHLSGGTYREEVMHSLFEMTLAPMPTWLEALARAPASHDLGDRSNWAALLGGVPEGQRHDGAIRLAGHFLRLGLPAAEVEQIILGYCERCTPPIRGTALDECRKIVSDLAARDAAKGETGDPGDGSKAPTWQLYDGADPWMFQDV